MSFKRQMFMQRTRWLSPLLLAILLTSSCQFVPKKYYQENQTKAILAQRSAARQAENIRQLREENAKLETMNAALHDELGELGTVFKQMKGVRQKEQALAQKAIMALKKEKGLLQRRFVTLQKKYKENRRKNVGPIKKTERVILPRKAAPNPELKPSTEPLSIPKREKGGSGNDRPIGKPQPKSPSQQPDSTSTIKLPPKKEVPLLEAKPTTVPTKMPSFVQETNSPQHEDKKDHKQTQIHKEQPTNNHTQNTSSISTSARERIDVNTRTAEDIVTHLGISADIAERIVANRPYRFPAEIVLKGAVTKKTYSKIKANIFAAP